MKTQIKFKYCLTRLRGLTLTIIVLFTLRVGQVWAESETLFSQTGTSGYSVPTGWSQSGTSTGNYIGFTSDGAYLTSPLYDPHDNLSLSYTVACYGSGTNHPLVIQLLDENGTVKATHTTGTPTSTSYISTNSPWNIGNINYKFRIKFYLSTAGKGVRLRNFTLTGDVVSSCTDPATALSVSASPTSITTDGTSTLSTSGGNGGAVTYTVTSANASSASIAGTTFSATAAGIYTIEASQDENGGKCGGTDEVNITVTLPTRTVSWKVNGSNWSSGVVTGNTNVESGSKISAVPTAPTSSNCDGSKVFVGWTETQNYSNSSTAPTDLFTDVAGSPTINSNKTFYAVFATASGGGAVTWSSTTLASLTSSDIFVISNGSYAMTNNNGTSSAPSTASITVSNGKITSTVNDNMKWNISGNASDGYIFYPNGSTTTWLYCNTTASSSSNNNIRVGDGDRKLWVPNNSGYLVTNDTYTDRYLSIYNNADFRGYTGTGNGAFVPQVFKYSGGTTYSNYETNCCQSLGQINGPILLTQQNRLVNGT